MSENTIQKAPASIIIKKAPLKFRGYLSASDETGNNNHELDTSKEAALAAQMFCADKPTECPTLLDYLEKAGYASLHIKEVAIETAVGAGLYFAEHEDTRDKGISILTLYASNPDTPLELKAKMVESVSELLLKGDTDTRKEAVFASNALIEADIPWKDKAKMLDPHYTALSDNDAYVRERAAKNLTLLAMLTFTELSKKDKIKMTWHFLDRLNKESNSDVKKRIILGLEVLAQSDIPQKFKDCINRNLEEVRG